MDPFEQRIEELRNKRASLLAECKVLADKDSLTAEESAEYDAKFAEAESIPAQITAVQEEKKKKASRQAQIAGAQRAAAPAPRRAASEPLPATGGAPMTTEPQWVNDPAKGWKTPRDFLLDVIEAGQDPGRALDNERLRYMAVGSDEARGNSDPAGGFLIPEAFSPDLMTVKPEDDYLGSLTTKVPMKQPIVKIPARTDKDHTTSVSGGLTVTRRPETVTATASVMTMEQVVLSATGLFGLSYATEELLVDSPISFAAILARGFSEQFAAQLMKERIRGSGVGEYQGVLNAPGTVSVSKETGQAAATILKENIDKMRSRCWGYGKAVWLANYDTLPQLRSLVQAVGTGGVPVPYFTTDTNGNAYLDGRPCIFTEFASTLGTVGDLILGNWSEYLEGIYQPMQTAESMHVRFVNHERTFKFWTRNAGQFWWKSALTPQNGANTLSPIVTLATRS